MSAARDVIIAALEAAAPADVRVIGYAREISPPAKQTWMVRADAVTPARVAGVGRARRYQFAVIVLPRKTAAGAADNELDLSLEDALAALDAAPNLTWERAERGVYQESFPAWEITINRAMKIGA